MRTVAQFLWASFRAALKVALEEILAGQQVGNCSWHCRVRYCTQRFDKFVAGQWTELLRASCVCAEEAATASRRRRRRRTNQDLESRASRASRFVQQGELSSGRCSTPGLEGAELAPGSRVTLAALRRHHAVPQNQIPELPPDRPIFHLDESLFSKNVWSARRGVAGGPSGMTSDHLRPLLEHQRTSISCSWSPKGFRGVLSLTAPSKSSELVE